MTKKLLTMAAVLTSLAFFVAPVQAGDVKQDIKETRQGFKAAVKTGDRDAARKGRAEIRKDDHEIRDDRGEIRKEKMEIHQDKKERRHNRRDK